MWNVNNIFSDWQLLTNCQNNPLKKTMDYGEDSNVMIVPSGKFRCKIKQCKSQLL